ncbi:MAG: protoporphyrinogen oxidase, partial [Burkholderiales bacterium]|nr:protoporphyrinogen oxidase [Burkholderiales bacterium]
AYQKLIEPMANGIFAGNPENMSLKACFPRLYQLEQEYGGLLKGFIKLVRKHDDNSNAPDSHKAVLTSFTSGTQTLTNALYDAIGEENIIRNDGVLDISFLNENWMITTKNHQFTASKIILSTPSYITSELLKNIDKSLSYKLSQIKYAPLAVVCLGFSLDNIKCDTNGFGYLFANKEESPILGTLWESSIFMNRAPNNKILFRSMLGGASNPDVLSLSDVELYKKTQASLYKIMSIDVLPEFKVVFRHENAIPQYQLNHCELVTDIEKLLINHRGLYIVGNAYHGVALNDCVSSAKKLANSIINA